MKARIYTDEEIKLFKANMFVLEVRYKRELMYDPLFKLWTIMMRLKFPELSAREIFELGGFNTDMLHNKLPQRRIKEWLDNYRKYGYEYFIPNKPYSNIRKLKDLSKGENQFKENLSLLVMRELEKIESNR